VAVKIQYPEAESCFNSDMTTLRRFAEVGSRGGVDGRLDGDGVRELSLWGVRA
jgi:predicted unusual protein kinase regulating ubiquinone biosynthesis (AarF/ABC1/UbiB family)